MYADASFGEPGGDERHRFVGWHGDSFDPKIRTDASASDGPGGKVPDGVYVPPGECATAPFPRELLASTWLSTCAPQQNPSTLLSVELGILLASTTTMQNNSDHAHERMR